MQCTMTEGFEVRESYSSEIYQFKSTYMNAPSLEHFS